MKRPSHFFVRYARGQIAVLYAGIAVALLGAIALGTDVALMYRSWAQAQKAVDAAAVAGANFLSGLSFTNTIATGCTGQPDGARKVACTYASQNGLAVGNLTLSEPDISTIKVGSSPFTYVAPVGGTVIVNGGSTTQIQFSRDGANFYITGQTAGMFPLSQGDQLIVTYPVAPPTMTFIPR